jgi:hypothetical protein
MSLDSVPTASACGSVPQPAEMGVEDLAALSIVGSFDFCLYNERDIKASKSIECREETNKQEKYKQYNM